VAYIEEIDTSELICLKAISKYVSRGVVSFKGHDAPCYLSARDKHVDFVGAFVGVECLNVHETFYDVIFKKNAISATQFTSDLADLPGNLSAVGLNSANLAYSCLSLI
jgi:hypothetical protein